MLQPNVTKQCTNKCYSNSMEAFCVFDFSSFLFPLLALALGGAVSPHRKAADVTNTLFH